MYLGAGRGVVVAVAGWRGPGLRPPLANGERKEGSRY